MDDVKPKLASNPLIAIVVLISIVFISLALVQISFQSQMQQAIDSSKRNFEEIKQTQIIMNITLAKIISEPQSNFTAQAEAIKKIESNVESLKRIEYILNSTSERLLNNSLVP